MNWTLTVEDVFAVGLGFDIAGGWLLALGLLAKAPQIHHGATINGLELLGTSALRDRVDAQIGLGFLIGGFLLQVVGYVLQEAGLGSGPSGAGPAVLFGAITAASVAIGLAAHRVLVGPFRRRIGRQIVDHLSAQGTPSGDWLVYWGQAVGHQPMAAETRGDYSARVWGVAVVEEADEPAVAS